MVISPEFGSLLQDPGYFGPELEVKKKQLAIILSPSVEDAEGGEAAAVGEERTSANGRQGTFNNDIKERDDFGTLMRALFTCDLEPCGVRKCAMMCARDKFACVRVP